MFTLTRVQFQHRVQSGHIANAIQAGRTEHVSEQRTPDFRFVAQNRETQIIHFPVINDVSNTTFKRHQAMRPIVEGAIRIAEGVIANTAHLKRINTVDKSI